MIKPLVNVSDRVERVQGRPTDLGRSGVVTSVSSDCIGGDFLVQVAEDDGTIFQCYDRQLKAVT